MTQVNPNRAFARAVGDRFYIGDSPCEICGTDERYTCNGGCISCVKARGRRRYHSMDDATLAKHRKDDSERYQQRRRHLAALRAAANEAGADDLANELDSL